MIGLGFYNAHNTSLDINGPFLRFTDEPQSTTVDNGGSITLSGTAVAEFKHNPSTIPGERVTNTGQIKYQWYINGAASTDITDSISGSQTNSITLSNLDNTIDDGKSIYLRATYEGSAYQSTSGAITAGIARSTGNGVNEPVDTSAAIVTINPTISITTHPYNATAAQGLNATFTVVASITDNSALSYQWSQDGVPLTDGSSVSGSNTDTLTISSPDKGTSNITVEVSHPTAGNSPVTSNTALFTVVSSRDIISYVEHDGDGTFFVDGEKNLFDSSLTITANPSTPGRLMSFHSPEADITVKVTMAAGAGETKNTVTGGEGGKSQFIITFEQNQEYVVELGSASALSGGANGGGGGAFLYKKGRLLVALGGGGGAGENDKGGKGGGIGFAGENGTGRDAGSGGTAIAEGALPTTGQNTNGTTGGRVSGCTVGTQYFANLYSPCDDYGLSKFLNFSGVPMAQSPEIQRGFKVGDLNRDNGGDGNGNATYVEYTLEGTRNAAGGGFNQKPSCLGIANGWFTRTGAPETVGNQAVRTLQIRWDGVTVYEGPYNPNSDGYILAGGYAYIFTSGRIGTSAYGWRYDDQCGVGDPNDPIGFGTGDYGNAFDVSRYTYVTRTGSGSGGGGSGANGGNAATVLSGSGGGGGSGYSSGDVTVLSSQLGSNTSENAFITFEYYVP